jgi:hypothetical protein
MTQDACISRNISFIIMVHKGVKFLFAIWIWDSDKDDHEEY